MHSLPGVSNLGSASNSVYCTSLSFNSDHSHNVTNGTTRVSSISSGVSNLLKNRFLKEAVSMNDVDIEEEPIIFGSLPLNDSLRVDSSLRATRLLSKKSRLILGDKRFKFFLARKERLQRETDLAIFWDLLQREDNSEDFLDLQDIMRKNKLNLAHDLSTHENQYSAPLQGSHIRSNSTSNTSNTSNIQTYDVSSTPLSDLGREKTVNLDLRGLKDFQDLQEILGDKIKVEHPYPPSSQRSKIKSNNASNTTPGLKENYFCEENPIKATSPAGDLETKLSSKQHGGGDSKPQSITHRGCTAILL